MPLLPKSSRPIRQRQATTRTRRMSKENGLPRLPLGLVSPNGARSCDCEPLCPLCSAATEAFLRRPSVPVHQNLLMDKADAARQATRGVLAMHVCLGCGFIFNAAFDPSLLAYGSDYDNTQTLSPSFERHEEELVRQLVEAHGVRGCKVLEVGCGKGKFLRRLIAYPGANNIGVGFDPSYEGPDGDPGRLTYIRRFFDADSGVTADVVVCRHVIEHVHDPLALLRCVRSVLLSSPRGRVFFETPCVKWILRHRVLWDVFYEHCSLFSAQTLTTAFAQAGLAVTAVQHVFGGQYLWAEARLSDLHPPSDDGVGTVVKLARRFGACEKRQIKSWQRTLDHIRRRGPVAVWGAGAKGVTFCNLADPDGERIACVVDINPAKQGKYVAGTGHPIIAPEQVPARGVAAVVVLNPVYVPEIADRLATHGSDAAVLYLMHAA